MPTGTELQERLLDSLRSRDPRLRVTWHPKAMAVAHLAGALTEPQQDGPEEIARRFLVEHQALFGIENVDQELGLAAVKTDPYGWHHVTFQQRMGEVPVWSGAVQVHVSKEGQVRTVRSNYRPGAKVDPDPAIDPQEAIKIAAEDARVKAPDELRRPPRNAVYVYEGEPHLAWVLELPGRAPSEELLAPQPTLWEYFVDAHTGKVIARFNLIKTHGPTNNGSGESVDNPPHLTQTTKTNLKTFHDHGLGTYLLQDTTRDIEIYDAAGDIPDWWTGAIAGDISRDGDNDWDDTTGMTSTDHSQRINCQAAEVDAHDHLARIYDYFQSKFGRNSLDNGGMTVKCYVHIRTTDSLGNTIAYNNAYWDPDNDHIAFGDGQYDGLDGPWGDSTFYSGALDVVAHEFTHGVTDHEIVDAWGDPHGFTYLGESGATNEMFSDVFAAFVDGDWRQGDRNVVGVLTAAGKMWRDLADPTRGLAYDPSDTIDDFLAKGVPQPDHYDIRYQGTGDYGGVHINSGILNFACYLATHGGVSHRAGRTPEDIRVYRKDRLGIGVEHAEQIYYLALTQYFNGAPGVGDNLDATFSEVRQALLDACDQFRVDGVHGVDGCDWKTLNTAFYAVGLHPVGENYGPDPMITPWGIWTGSGAPYQSPDIWCEDAGGAHVNAEKGIVNRFVAQIHNIGDQPAEDVIVRFSYSPFGFGYRHEDFKWIDDRTVDLAAGETSTVAVDWDLTDLTEDHGGLWPRPIGDFDHFCARVEIVSDNDVNACNNLAQHNFVDVLTHAGDTPSTALIIANPSREMETKVVLLRQATLPRGWQVLLDEALVPKSMQLQPGERRVVKLSVKVPDQPLILHPIAGRLVGKLDGRMPGKIEGRLDQVTYLRRRYEFRGRVSGTFTGKVVARFQGDLEAIILDRDTGELKGTLQGMAFDIESGKAFTLKGEVSGRLTPERRVSLGARVGGVDVGGVDLNLMSKLP